MSVIEGIAVNEEIEFVEGVLEGAVEGIDVVFAKEGSERKKNYVYGERMFNSFESMM